MYGTSGRYTVKEGVTYLYTVDRIVNTIRVQSMFGDTSCDVTGPLKPNVDYTAVF